MVTTGFVAVLWVTKSTAINPNTLDFHASQLADGVKDAENKVVAHLTPAVAVSKSPAFLVALLKLVSWKVSSAHFWKNGGTRRTEGEEARKAKNQKGRRIRKGEEENGDGDEGPREGGKGKRGRTTKEWRQKRTKDQG
jgi:hypothetical protein